MSRTTTTMVALFVAVALGAVVAGSASASWFVNNAELKTSAALATLARQGQRLDIHIIVGGVLVRIECPGPVHFLGASLLPPREVHVDLVFLTCATAEPATKCNLEGPGGGTTAAIETVPLIGLASLAAKSPEGRVAFAPGTGKVLTTLPFSAANTCVFAGEQPVKGSFTMALPSGQTEGAEQTFNGLGSVENNSLEIGAGGRVFIDGGDLLELLTSHSKWSFR